MTNFQDRALPASVELEKLVLGAAILDPASLQIALQLSSEDFALEKHRRIFAAMQHLDGAGAPVDRATIAQEIIDRGQLQAVDGMSYLTSLDDGLPQMYQLDGYVAKLRDFTTRRHAILATNGLLNELMEPGSGPDAIERATATLSAIAAAKGGSPLRNSEEIIERYGGMDRLLSPPAGVRIPPRWAKLAEMIPALQEGELWIFGGLTSRGKTILGCLFALGSAEQGVGTSIYSMEMPDGAILKRTLSAMSGVSFGRVWKGGPALEPHHRTLLSIARSRLADLPWWVADNATPTVADIRQQLRKARQAGRKVELVIVDYLQLVSGKGENSNARVSAISRGLKLLAMDFKIPVIALSQLSRPPKADATWEPSRHYLRDSGSIEQDADGILFIHSTEKAIAEAKQRDADGMGGVVQGKFILDKQRNGAVGPIPVEIDGRYMRIEERG